MVDAAGNDSSEQNSGTDAPVASTSQVKFRARKRAKKARTKRERTNTEESADDLDNGMTRAELMLMKEAQKLREENRKTALDVRIQREDKNADGANKGSDNNIIADGLQSNFALEKTGNVVEERMVKYIEERMKMKFGDKDVESADQQQPAYDDERELFVIPERLRVAERPMYDPGEGMPAGVEEVELSEEARRRNQEETLKAHRELIESKARKGDVEKEECLPGNFSCNYAQHRNEWIDVHLGWKNQRATGEADLATNGGNHVQDGHSAAKHQRDTGGRSSHQASDFAVAERFKKRWKR